MLHLWAVSWWSNLLMVQAGAKSFECAFYSVLSQVYISKIHFININSLTSNINQSSKMSETSPLASPVKRVTKTTAAKKPKAPAAHPPFAVMIIAAIKALTDRTGSSRQAILKYICAHYKVTADKADVHLKMALKRGVTGGTLKMAKSSGKGAGTWRQSERGQETS